MSDTVARVDDLEARMDAFSNFKDHIKQRLEDLEQENIALRSENEDLRERLGKLESVVDTDFNEVGYERMERDEKVRYIRWKIAQIARNTNGKAMMDYKDVMTLFDGKPSPGHTFDLMSEVANKEGFDFQERTDQNNRIVVNTDAVKDDAVFHAANNRVEAGGD